MSLIGSLECCASEHGQREISARWYVSSHNGPVLQAHRRERSATTVEPRSSAVGRRYRCPRWRSGCSMNAKSVTAPAGPYRSLPPSVN